MLTLKTELQQLLGTGWGVTYSMVTDALTFTHDAAFIFSFAPGLQPFLGFKAGTASAAARAESPLHWQLSSEIPVDVTPNDSVCVMCDVPVAPNQVLSMDTGDQIFVTAGMLASIPLTAPFYSLLTWHAASDGSCPVQVTA